jgi:rhodanese-related sulfurtransferase
MDYTTTDRQKLEARFAAGAPSTDESDGWALVNVLDADAFEEARIPASINIPLDTIDEFERRFAKDKRIVVYCASESCDASPSAAKKLAERGFERVEDYEGGLSDWRSAGRPITTG